MKKETLFLIIVGVASLIIMGGGIMALSSDNQQVMGVEVIAEEFLVKDDAYSTGAEDAKVTIVEFSDFQCPACAVNAPALKPYLEQNPDQIKLIFRHFPLSYHNNARLAASAAEAAGRQDKFWQMHDLLFANQLEWQDLPEEEAIAEFEKYAVEFDIDLEKFQQDLSDPVILEKIDRDIKDGYQAKVGGTPSFYINGRPVLGVGSPEFEQVLQEELSK